MKSYIPSEPQKLINFIFQTLSDEKNYFIHKISVGLMMGKSVGFAVCESESVIVISKDFPKCHDFNDRISIIFLLLKFMQHNVTFCIVLYFHDFMFGSSANESPT
jgi:hypothetical protein